MTSPHLASTKDLDATNASYFTSLYRKKQAAGQKQSLWIHEEGKDPPAGSEAVYPTELIDKSEKLRARFQDVLPRVDYATLLASSKDYLSHARKAAVWVKKLQAGTGSTLKRPLHGAKIGSKGTDLRIPLEGQLVSLAEVLLLQGIYQQRRGGFAEVIFQDLVSSETAAAVQAIWNKPTLWDPTITYLEWTRQNPQVRSFGQILQQHVQTLDENGQLTSNRLAPAGHGLFAQDAIRSALDPVRRPETTHSLVGVLGNGEDLGAPDELMVGYLLAEKIPIAMITTEKTAADGKGGILAVVESDPARLTILETAQAEQAGQAALFRSLGGQANTNQILINYSVLEPLLRQLLSEHGMEALEASITPDLIQNWKTQTDSDGVSRRYLQLEGAMGSVVMNLDRTWRRLYGKPLVHIITVPLQHRTRFFAPVKTAFDFFMLFHSDRFKVIHNSGQSVLELTTLQTHLPSVELTDPESAGAHYQDLEKVLAAFQDCKILNLKSLKIHGQVNLAGSELRGNVRIVNETGAPLDLRNRLIDGETIERRG